MPVKHGPLPKQPRFAASADASQEHGPPYYLFLLFLFLAVPLLVIHLQLLDLPYFWDEHGQFIPTALDLLQHGWWVARSTIPNVHPPGVEAYLALWYKALGYSIPVTRCAMLLLANAGLLLVFLLAIELSKGAVGAPAFWPPLFLLVSPLFYTQSFMAQLDMPAMVFTALVLLLFLKNEFFWAAAASVFLVLSKETGLVTPFVLFFFMLRRGYWLRAFYFVLPVAALAYWLLVLHRATGQWLGDAGFAHYNVEYSLHPVRIALTLLRRLYYIFFAEFRFIGTLVLLLAVRRCAVFKNRGWHVAIAVFVMNLILVSVLGGAELERYLLPILPLFYIAVAIALSTLRAWKAGLVIAALVAGLAANIFWNPPYPFAYENNYAMVDFVHLQQTAAKFVESDLKGSTIATAWPYTSALRHPEFGFVDAGLKVVETHDFHLSSIERLPPATFDVLITYTRTWTPPEGVIAFPMVRQFLTRFYEWEPAITPEQCVKLGLYHRISWTLRGQTISVYTRTQSTRPFQPL